MNRIVATIQADVPACIAVYLFGSEASRQANPESDVDLAILARKTLNPVQTWELAQKLASVIGRDVDVLDLRSASTVMRMQVLSRGYRLACFDAGPCETFEDFAYADYARLNEERAAILADIEKRGAIYG